MSEAHDVTQLEQVTKAHLAVLKQAKALLRALGHLGRIPLGVRREMDLLERAIRKVEAGDE